MEATVEPYSNSEPARPSTVLDAALSDGRRLPVIDIAHPAFAVTLSAAQLEARANAFERESRPARELPAEMRAALAQSTLGAAVIAASGSYLAGLPTYVFKLGPDNLGDCDSPLDRQLATSFPALTMRIRLQDIVEQLAGGLHAALRQVERSRPLLLVNIAGGAAADSWNALMRLRRQEPGSLDGRRITIAVLDNDVEGPAFGAAALRALMAPGATLAGLDLEYRHIEYDWTRADALQRTLSRLGAEEAVCGLSSEGGLFEYASDDDVVANLRAFAAVAAREAVVAGSVTSDSEHARALAGRGAVAIVPRSLAAFSELANLGGWIVESAKERPFIRHVRLVKV
jgi:hypothetical protein